MTLKRNVNKFLKTKKIYIYISDAEQEARASAQRDYEMRTNFPTYRFSIR